MSNTKHSMWITDWFQALTPRQRAGLPYSTLITAVFAVYANIYQNAFVWDDWNLIVYNDTLRHWSSLPAVLFKTTLGPFYRPLQALLYFLIYQTFGLSGAAFHGVNVLLQAANTCLVYRLGCRLGFYPRASFAAALLWGIHSLWVESVAMVAGTADLMTACFFLLGLLALLPDFKPRKFWLSGLFLILALGCKEFAVVFPALAVFTLFLVSRERLKPAAYIKTWPLWLLAIAYIIGWLMCPALNNHFGDNLYQDPVYVEFYKHSIINRTLTSLATLPVYLGLMLTPANFRLAWDFPIVTTVWDWQVIAGLVIVAVSLLQIIRGRGKRGLPLTWGLLWFAASFSPYTGIPTPIDGRISEHWIYVPAIGLFLGAAQTAAVWMEGLPSKKYARKAPGFAAGLVVAAALALGIKTHTQNKILHDPGSLFETVITYNPAVFPRYELGVYYFQQKEYAKAAEQWRAVEADNYTAFLNKDAVLFMHSSLAFIYLNALSDKKDNVSVQDVIRALPSATHIPEAIEELNMVRNLNPKAAYVSSFLSVIYYYQGDKNKGDYYKDMAEKNAPGK